MSEKKVAPEWKGDPDSDQTARVDGYVLRAQDVGASVWWAVFDKNLTRLTQGHRKNMRSAKVKALYAMKKHQKQMA